MSKAEKFAARAARAHLRAKRGMLAVQVERFNQARRTLMRANRQRHASKINVRRLRHLHTPEPVRRLVWRRCV